MTAVIKADKLNQYIYAQWFINRFSLNFKHRTACKYHLNINNSITMKYKNIYNFILILMKKEWILNAFEKSAEKVSDLNKLVSVTHNNKNSISFLNESCKTSVMKWKAEDMSVNKLMKQMKVLTLTLKIVSTVSASASLYPSVAMPQPAVAYSSQTNFNALVAAVAAAGNLRSAAVILSLNQCVFCQLEGHQKLWNRESFCFSLIMFIQTGKMHLNVNKQIM